MSSIIMSLFTTKHIGTREYAERFLKILEKYNLLPDKIGLYEPLKKAYSFEEAIKMWTTDVGTSPGYQAGNLTGKKKEPNVRFDMRWNLGERARLNNITIWFTKKSFKQCRDNIENLFKDLIRTLDSFHGYITDFNIKYLQHVTGTIETRMDGIFWCNYFGEIYLNFFGREKILSAPWYKIEILDEDKIIAYLSKEPYLTREPDDKELIEYIRSADKLKEYLGKDSFGDVEAWKATVNLPPVYRAQYKNVPKLDLSEIRRPISKFV
jgi:hypothetical protein